VLSIFYHIWRNHKKFATFPGLEPGKTGDFRILLTPTHFRGSSLAYYALNIILNGNFEPVFPPIISFIKIFVAENVAKSPVE